MLLREEVELLSLDFPTFKPPDNGQVAFYACPACQNGIITEALNPANQLYHRICSFEYFF